MKKFLKWFLGITAVGAVVGLVIAYFCRDMGCDECEDDEGGGEDFELDKDLKPARDREYVPLKRNGKDTSQKEAAKPDEPVAEKKAEEEKKSEEEKAE